MCTHQLELRCWWRMLGKGTREINQWFELSLLEVQHDHMMSEFQWTWTEITQAILCYRLLIAVHLHSCTQDPACTLYTWWLCHESHPLSTAAPLFPNLHQFPHGRRFKQWTADDSKALMKVHCFNLRLMNYWYLKFLCISHSQSHSFRNDAHSMSLCIFICLLFHWPSF